MSSSSLCSRLHRRWSPTRKWASMAIYRVISGYKGWIEDVVVDEFARGKKIGTQLIQQLITKGKELGLGEILLFTSPTNEAAIKLYENEGFKRKRCRSICECSQTNVSP